MRETVWSNKQGVGSVQGHRDVGGGGGAAVAQPDATLGEGFLLVRDGTVGVEVQPGLLHQPGGLHLTDPAWGGGDQPVREQRRLHAEVGGLPGDQPGPPHRNRTGSDQRPEPRQPAGQFEGVGDQLATGVVADPEGSGEVDRCELRDPWSTRTGQRDQAFAVQVGLTPVGRQLIGRAGVQPGPLKGHLQLFHGCRLGRAPSRPDTVDHLGGGEVGCRGHGPILGGFTDVLDAVFEDVDNFLALLLGCGDLSAYGALVSSDRSLRSLLDHRWSRRTALGLV